jgi:hypothetical protein
MIRIPILLFFLFCSVCVFAQTDTTLLSITKNLPGAEAIENVQAYYSKLSAQLDEKLSASLNSFQKLEDKVQRKIAKKDSLLAGKLFNEVDKKYAALQSSIEKPLQALKNKKITQYIPALDSLQTGFSYLSQSGARLIGVPKEQLQAYANLSNQLKDLQLELQKVSDVKAFIKSREAILKEQLAKLGYSRQLKQLNKEVYYYTQQWNEYKSLLNDPDKACKKVLYLLKDNDEFKNFMAQNSVLAGLFQIPGGSGSSANAIPGLQTVASVQQQVGMNLAGSGVNPTQFIAQQTQKATLELNKWKDKLNSLGGGTEELEMPDFTPNQQKTKSLWKRIDLGFNIQSTRSNTWLPAITDLALSAGYKINDKSTVGVGAGFKLGWGKDISHIQISGQGVSLRSFLDIKLKGNFWITGGFEKNYQSEFTQLEQLYNINAWQNSGLVGLTKKYKIGKKAGNLQLLWDFLSYNQLPQTQPLKFRIGYSF